MLALAVLVIAGVQSAVFLQVQISDAPGSGDAAVSDVQAERLATQILGQAGEGWYSAPCVGDEPDLAAFDPGGVTRFGLGDEPCASSASGFSFEVSLDKLLNIREAAAEGFVTDGVVDYGEARASLGLDDVDFHIRTRPQVSDADGLFRYGTGDPNLRPLYVGHYTGAPQSADVLECGWTASTRGADVWATVANGGSTTSAFKLRFTLELDQRTVESYAYTGLLPSGGTETRNLSLPKSNDWNWDGPKRVTVSVASPLGTELDTCLVNVAQAPLTGTSAGVLLFPTLASLDEYMALGTLASSVDFVAYTGTGAVSFVSTNTLYATGLLLGSHPPTGSDPIDSTYQILPPVLEKNFYVEHKTLLGAYLGQSMLFLPGSSLGTYTPPNPSPYTPSNSVVPEGTYLSTLAGAFDAFVYNATYHTTDVPYAAGGDIVPDRQAPLEAVLAAHLVDDLGQPTLDDYNLIVAGSNVDHTQVQNGSIRDTLAAWVKAGGLLVLLGSKAQNATWTDSLFSSEIRAADGQATAATYDAPGSSAETTHPLLRVPNEFSTADLDDQSLAWDIGVDYEAEFESVLLHGNATLATSRQGSFGLGRVVLASYRPYDALGSGPTGPCDPDALEAYCLGLQLLQNAASFLYDDLSVDFGPAPPTDRPVGSTSRIANVYHPGLGQDIGVLVTVYVF